MLDAAGWSATDIADVLCADSDEVRLILSR